MKTKAVESVSAAMLAYQYGLRCEFDFVNWVRRERKNGRSDVANIAALFGDASELVALYSLRFDAFGYLEVR